MSHAVLGLFFFFLVQKKTSLVTLYSLYHPEDQRVPAGDESQILSQPQSLNAESTLIKHDF